MNLYEYTLDSLRTIIRILLKENQNLREQLNKSGYITSNNDVFKNDVDKIILSIRKIPA